MTKFPPRTSPKLSIAIPASFVEDVPHLREKTYRVGLVGRAAAIFRVEEIIVYPDIFGQDQSKDAEFIAAILSYMETPQYLRKRLFPFKRVFRYVGILPPLRTPHHPIVKRLGDLKGGEFREGVVVEAGKGGSYVDIGVEKPVLVPRVRLPAGKRVTVKVLGATESRNVSLIRPEEINIYWGYHVSVSSLTLGQVIKGKVYDLVVATSRYGDPLMRVVRELRRLWKNSDNVLVAFGSPSEGLEEILAHENLKLREIADFTVNTVPFQGTETVRTEEAIYASLAAFNILL